MPNMSQIQIACEVLTQEADLSTYFNGMQFVLNLVETHCNQVKKTLPHWQIYT